MATKNIHIHLPALLKKPVKARDASNKFVTKVGIRLPKDDRLDQRSGGILPRGTVVYKEGSGYRPWFIKNDLRLQLDPKDLVSGDIQDASAPEWAEFRRETWEKLEVGKTYKIAGRSGTVMKKSENPGSGNRTGGGNPMALIKWKDAREVVKDSRIDDFRQFCKINRLRIDDPKALEKFAKMNHLTPAEVQKVAWVTLNPLKARDAGKLVARNTAPDVWRVFREGHAVEVAGPFKTAAEANAWIKSHTNDSSAMEQDYDKWCKGKGLDPQSRVTFKRYVKEKGLNSNMENLLERSAKIGQAARDAGNVEYLTANDILEKYGPTFLSKVQRMKEATAPDGSIIKVDGRGFTRTGF